MLCICWFGKQPFCFLVCKGVFYCSGGELTGVKEGSVLELLQGLNEGSWILKASQMGLGRMFCQLG